MRNRLVPKWVTLTSDRGRLRSCQSLRHIRHWTSRKSLEIEACFQRTTNKTGFYPGINMRGESQVGAKPDAWRAEGVVGLMGKPPPHQLGVRGSAVSSPAGAGAEPRGNWNLVQLQTSNVTPEIWNSLNKRFVMYRLYQWLLGDPARGGAGSVLPGGVFKCEGLTPLWVVDNPAIGNGPRL